jgi:ATP-dependent DNA helicase RecG
VSELLAVKGIGKVLEIKLKSLGINNCIDLVRTFPIRYDTHRIDSYEEAMLNTEIVLPAKIFKNASVAYIRRRLTKMTIIVLIDKYEVSVSIYNREYLRLYMIKDAEIVITGRFEPDFKHFVASDIQLRKNYQEGIIPVYSVANISDKIFAKIVLGAYNIVKNQLIDDIPDTLLKKREVAGIADFYRIVHHPKTMTDILAASRRIKYDELLKFALKIVCMKSINNQTITRSKTYDIAKVRQFIASLPFELTDDQKIVTNEIFRDLKQSRQMMRLLQGDVGSGKTIVAMIAAYAVVSGGEQVALMAPTEILAHQHYKSFTELIAPFGVKIAFLASDVNEKSKSQIISDLSSGLIDIVIGTHALIQDRIRFRQLGFVIIDEQHRFGVKQRKILREKGWVPDVLFMSATPIPRTLAISVFGDMDVSSIRSMPQGRKKVITAICDYSGFNDVIHHCVSELKKGHQVYIIVPLITESHKTNFMAVDTVVKELRHLIPPEFTIAALHGKLGGEEKNQILTAFSMQKIAVLVSTTVVEVGVDVPNATEMVILDCERFGLSQLHQLRGRVGRGKNQAYCHLVTDAILLGTNRFAILETTTDGFVISEEDLRQRGPGEVFGEEQTGIPKFRMANLITDHELLEQAFVDAHLLIDSVNEKAKALVATTFFGIKEPNLD